MEVQTLVQILQISNDRTIRKAEEFFRLSKVRAPFGIGSVHRLSSSFYLIFIIEL